MRLLLDTDALLWSLISPTRLSAAAREAIESPENRVYVSAVSPWEISIKASKGNLPTVEDLETRVAEIGFDLLPISLRHAKGIERLPHHHGDPFDRMLIAQAQIEGMTLVTSDRAIRRYSVAVLPAV